MKIIFECRQCGKKVYCTNEDYFGKKETTKCKYCKKDCFAPALFRATTCPDCE